jgi:HEPN domain-containing protein
MIINAAKRSLVQNWLHKAQRDLATARKLSAGPDPYFDTAIYHCQQAAEKAVKGFLVFHDQRFEKTHDIRLLAAQAAAIESRFGEWEEVGLRLTPYAAAYRYPSENLMPDEREFQQAITEAEQFCSFVSGLLPLEVQPGTHISSTSFDE